MRAYIIAMVIRTISFPLAVWAFMAGWVVVGFVFAAAATFLPQVAVMMANAVDRRTTPAGTVTSPQRALPTGTDRDRAPDPHADAHPDPGPDPHSTHRPTDGHDAHL